MKVNSSETEAVQAVSTPQHRNAKEVARFLGMTSWPQQFIPNFAKLAEPLYQLQRKRVKFVWTSEA